MVADKFMMVIYDDVNGYRRGGSQKLKYFVKANILLIVYTDNEVLFFFQGLSSEGECTILKTWTRKFVKKYCFYCSVLNTNILLCYYKCYV